MVFSEQTIFYPFFLVQVISKKKNSIYLKKNKFQQFFLIFWIIY